MKKVLEKVLCPVGIHWWTQWNAEDYRHCVGCGVKQRRMW